MVASSSNTESLRVTDLRFIQASAELRRSGLLGWLAVTLNGALQIDGLTLRRTREGVLTVAYPRRRDRNGVEHSVVKPVSDDARRRIEAEILAALAPMANEARP